MDEIELPEDRGWIDQQAVLTKLRSIAEDAKTYEQDTGAYVLSIVFPLLSLPPAAQVWIANPKAESLKDAVPKFELMANFGWLLAEY